jgi:hypothetical protein
MDDRKNLMKETFCVGADNGITRHTKKVQELKEEE